MRTWQEFQESKMEKIWIIMRGLPGTGKSTTVRQLLVKYGGDFDHVFSTDARYTPVSNKIRRLGQVSPDTISLEQAIMLCEEIKKMWFGAKWSQKKDEAQPQFLEFKKLMDQGNYHGALEYAKASHELFEIVEYLARWDGAKIGGMHAANLGAFKQAVDMGMTPVIVDNTNTTPKEAAPYALYAKEAGYEVKIQEPTSPHWLAHRDLLGDKYANKQKLDDFAKLLADKNVHGVPYETLQKMIARWQHNMNISHLTDDEKKNVK